MPSTIQIPDDAPFTLEQRKWLSNLFGKILSSSVISGDEQLGVAVTVLYASQTGNAEGLAKKLLKLLKKGSYIPQIIDVATYDVNRLTSEKNLLLITSTYGDGEPPDSAASFHKWLHSESAPLLEGVKFAVLALGDTSYPDFCKCGAEFDQRFATLGAERLLERVDCDVEFDAEFTAWSSSILAALAPNAQSTNADHKSEELEDETGYCRARPFPARLLSNRNLNTVGAEKQTHHVELSLAESGLIYEVGDALGVMPRNSEKLVDEILSLLPFPTDVNVPAAGGGEISLREALLTHYDLRTLNHALITQWQARSGSEFLGFLLANDDKNALNDFLWGRELIDLVIDYPASFSGASEFVSILRKLQPRLYSISSSPKAHPGEVHLTVALVSYQSHGRERFGTCSSYLSQLQNDSHIGVYVHSNPAFRLPKNGDTPLIMVGPGTGIAPFRAFLEERHATSAKGANWLFFGNPYQATDFLYEKELQAFIDNGILNRLDTAFSRDQPQKIYVQDRMKEHGAELWKWIDAGACFYICGDASRMAKDVDAVVHEVIAMHGGKSMEEAMNYVAQMKKEKRYLRDVY